MSVIAEDANMPPLINGVQEIAELYDYFILDIFGVIHDGIKPFPGTLKCLQELKNMGKATCLLSNSPRRVNGAVGQMDNMGISGGLFDHAVTSGEATFQALKHRDETLGDDCWFIGTSVVSEILEGLDLNLVDGSEDASFILNSIPGTETSAVEILKKQLQIAADKGLPMICANPDLVVNIGVTQYECAGTFAKYYEELGGHVIYHGKPHGPVYEMCYELLGSPDKTKVCAIGDSFHTDITGANRFGIDSVMNLVGIHWEEIVTNGDIDPRKMHAMLSAQSTHPTYMMSGFDW